LAQSIPCENQFSLSVFIAFPRFVLWCSFELVHLFPLNFVVNVGEEENEEKESSGSEAF
jgi:hypothetical protein